MTTLGKPKLLLWDIESTGLDADFASILCVGHKWLGEPRSSVQVLSVRDTNGICKCCNRVENPSNDKALLEELWPLLAEADGWITWFGVGYDEKFVQSRLVYHDLPVLPPVYHIDGWATARTKLKLHSNRLKSVQDFLGLKDTKTALLPAAWLNAQGGGLEGLEFIEDHCRRDVWVLEAAYKRLLPLISKHPNYNHFLGLSTQRCPNCGGAIQYRGYHRTKQAVYRRWQCQVCGKWDHAQRPEAKQ